MSKLLKLRRGKKEIMPKLSEAELVYAADTNELYIGTNQGNMTPNFIGGALSDTTKGKLILKKGRKEQVRKIADSELFYLEDKKSLAIGIGNNAYYAFNEEINMAILELFSIKRDRNDFISSDDIAPNQIGLHHLATDVIDSINATANEQISIILGAGAITTGKLANGTVTTTKLASNSVDSDKIKNDAVTMDKLSPELRAIINRLVTK